MNSRIILSRADFSANNIGQIIELSDLTKKVLAKQTQYDEDSQEAVALNTFLANLTTDGFIGGENPLLTSLFITALANDHDELLYNIASLGSDGYPENGMSADEINATQKAYSVNQSENHKLGLCRVVNVGDTNIGPNDTRLDIDTKLISENVDYDSFSIVFYNIGNMVPNVPQFMRNASSAGVIQIHQDEVRIVYGANTQISTALSGSTFNGFNGFSYVKNETKFEGISDNKIIGENTISSTEHLNNSGKGNIFRIGEFRYGIYYCLPFFATGKYINPTKMLQLKGYVDTLMTALHVTV